MDTLIRSHWEMVDCLFDEVYLGKHEDTIHSQEAIYELFRYFASHDPRFNAVGLCWNPKGLIQYTDAAGNVSYAEGAIASFLGLETKTLRGYTEAGHAALRIIYKQFADKVEARSWIRWHVQKMYGYDLKVRDLWKGYPRNFPVLTPLNNDLSHQKD